MSEKMQILGVTSELGAGTRGSSLGLNAIQVASLKYDPEFFAKHRVRRLKTLNERLYREDKMRYARRLDSIAEMYQRIKKMLSETMANGAFPFVIAGDHSNAGGTIAGIKKCYPKKRLGVIWVDAHADLHSPYTSPSGNVHGMPLATALHDDNLENKNNQPDDDVIWHWNEMKGPNQRVLHSDLFFIGVRDAEQPELNMMKKHNMPNVTVDELREKGPARVGEMALNHLKDCDMIYVSFDVDSLDPSVSRGTGTPVEHGLMEDEALQLLLRLVEDPRLCCFEITEVNPLLDDKGNEMAETAFRIIKEVAVKIENNLSQS